jgi:hypothetical protein
MKTEPFISVSLIFNDENIEAQLPGYTDYEYPKVGDVISIDMKELLDYFKSKPDVYDQDVVNKDKPYYNLRVTAVNKLIKFTAFDRKLSCEVFVDED